MAARAIVAAYVFLACTVVTIAFQIALVAGAPWGRLTWGGRFPGALSASMRFVAACSALLLGAFGLIVATRGGLLEVSWVPQTRTLTWIVVMYCAIGVLANAATPSRWERRIWLPVVLLMLASSLLVALS